MANNGCPKCGGTGKYYYPNTGTWNTSRNLIVGRAFTWGICNECWGSGAAENPGKNLMLELENKRREQEVNNT